MGGKGDGAVRLGGAVRGFFGGVIGMLMAGNFGNFEELGAAWRQLTSLLAEWERTISWVGNKNRDRLQPQNTNKRPAHQHS